MKGNVIVVDIKKWIYNINKKLFTFMSRNQKITPKGKQVKKYCKKIIDGEDPYTSAYEQIIKELMKKTGATRIEAARSLYIFLDNLKEENPQW